MASALRFFPTELSTWSVGGRDQPARIGLPSLGCISGTAFNRARWQHGGARRVRRGCDGGSLLRQDNAKGIAAYSASGVPLVRFYGCFAYLTFPLTY